MLTEDGLRPDRRGRGAARGCSPQTVGKDGGSWCPFGRGRDQAGDQRDDDARRWYSIRRRWTVYRDPGGADRHAGCRCDKPLANLVVRLCDVHPDGAQPAGELRRIEPRASRGHEMPAEWCRGFGIGCVSNSMTRAPVIPAGHRVSVALSTAYWPMVWPGRTKRR